MAERALTEQAPGGIWTRYWRAGALHSCGCAYTGNYEGAVARFWDNRFEALREGARVVDLGTGNGAIPLLARACAERLGRRWEIHGVDLADIDPAAADPARVAGIRFHPRTSATALPFPDGSVDLVTGQYAFEYLPRAPALDELARVLADDGAAAFVLHSRDSEIARTTGEQLESCRVLFASGLFEAATELGALMAGAPDAQSRRALAADPRAVAARDRVNDAARAVSDRIAAVRTPDMLQVALGRCSDALQNAHRLGADGVAAQVAAARTDLEDERQRLRDLDAAALDQAGLDELVAGLRSVGLSQVDTGTLDHEGGARLGWTVSARR